MKNFKIIYIACICLESTGEFICEIRFDKFASKELKILAEFCGDKYYVASLNSHMIDD